MKIRMRHFTTLDKVARDGDIDRNAITMDSRHHLLALIDTLHEKYSFQDAEYKELADALAVNKKPLDIENAKYVLIKYDRVEASWDYNVDEPKLVKQEDEHKLMEVSAVVRTNLAYPDGMPWHDPKQHQITPQELMTLNCVASSNQSDWDETEPRSETACLIKGIEVLARA